MPTEEPEWLTAARERGLVVREGKPSLVPGKAKRAKPELVAAAFDPFPRWTIPLHVTAGDNNRGKAKIGRAGYERRVVSRHLGGATLVHLAPFATKASMGIPIDVTLTRLGGRALDDDNLHAAMKYVRDTCALMMGFDDNASSPLRWEYGQEPGGAVGVRVTIEAAQSAQVDIG